MADCHDLFIDFHGTINLTSDKKVSLRTSRNALRDKIKKYFTETMKVTAPKFHGQGSYMMNTMVNPLDGEFDIDDGVYIQHLDGVDEKDWPAPSTVHSWIVKATKDHASTPPEDKNSCVRVIFKAQYHIDLPSYVIADTSPKLAHKGKGWIFSDPREMTKWLRSKVKESGEQLRRTVQYLKAWADFQEGITKLPSGLVLTVLASNHFSAEDGRDDAALVATAKAIHSALSVQFSVTKPVVPYEDLLIGWSETRRDSFLSKLNSLVTHGSKALEEEDKEKACAEWIKALGERFPEYEPPEGGATEMAKRTSSPAILGNHGRSAYPG